MKAICGSTKRMGAEYEVEEIPQELKKKARRSVRDGRNHRRKRRRRLLHKYIEGEAIAEEELKAALRKRDHRR